MKEFEKQAGGCLGQGAGGVGSDTAKHRSLFLGPAKGYRCERGEGWHGGLSFGVCHDRIGNNLWTNVGGSSFGFCEDN